MNYFPTLFTATTTTHSNTKYSTPIRPSGGSSSSKHAAFNTFLFPSFNHTYTENNKTQTIQKLLYSNKRECWLRALSNEFGRLAKGNIHGINSTDTIEFILQSDLPAGKKVTYATFVCDHRPLKFEPWRNRCVVGGDKLPYSGDTSSPATSILDTKLIVNSVISDSSEGVRFLSTNLGDFFLGSEMKPQNT